MDLIEKAETAYQLQIKAQKTAEEAISHLRAYMREQENVVFIEITHCFIFGENILVLEIKSNGSSNSNSKNNRFPNAIQHILFSGRIGEFTRDLTRIRTSRF